MLSFVLPTRNRPERLARTLRELAVHDANQYDRIGGAEVIIVDNASDAPVQLDADIALRLHARVIRLERNIGAAARNIGVEKARGEWIVMLDDDSHPVNAGFVDVLVDAPHDVAAIGADIVLPDGTREHGGLPEVFIGCGVAIRRHAYLDAGGYDPTFDYYVEEYDLSAKLILAGWRILHDRTGNFRVVHEKVVAGRDFNVIMRRLVRNNVWVMQRYAPEDVRAREIGRTIVRYAAIAIKEHAAIGFVAGMRDLSESLATQQRNPMNTTLWERFIGKAAARSALADLTRHTRVAMVDVGKNADVIREILDELGVEVVSDVQRAEVLVVGTLSPGPMRDAWNRSARRARMCM